MGRRSCDLRLAAFVLPLHARVLLLHLLGAPADDIELDVATVWDRTVGCPLPTCN